MAKKLSTWGIETDGAPEALVRAMVLLQEAQARERKIKWELPDSLVPSGVALKRRRRRKEEIISLPLYPSDDPTRNRAAIESLGKTLYTAMVRDISIEFFPTANQSVENAISILRKLSGRNGCRFWIAVQDNQSWSLQVLEKTVPSGLGLGVNIIVSTKRNPGKYHIHDGDIKSRREVVANRRKLTAFAGRIGCPLRIHGITKRHGIKT